MWTKIREWLQNRFKSDDDWYLESAADVYDLEIRMLKLQRQELNHLYNRYWYGK